LGDSEEEGWGEGEVSAVYHNREFDAVEAAVERDERAARSPGGGRGTGHAGRGFGFDGLYAKHRRTYTLSYGVHRGIEKDHTALGTRSLAAATPSSPAQWRGGDWRHRQGGWWQQQQKRQHQQQQWQLQNVGREKDEELEPEIEPELAPSSPSLQLQQAFLNTPMLPGLVEERPWEQTLRGREIGYARGVSEGVLASDVRRQQPLSLEVDTDSEEGGGAK
jgi:hypothetical protein